MLDRAAVFSGHVRPSSQSFEYPRWSITALYDTTFSASDAMDWQTPLFVMYLFEGNRRRAWLNLLYHGTSVAEAAELAELHEDVLALRVFDWAFRC